MKRRDFIQLSAFTAAAISFPLLHSCRSTVNENAISQPVFLSRLFDKETINEVGKSYLQKSPQENNEDKLVQLLANNSTTTDEKGIHEYLDKTIRNDFETGNTITVKGWVLAITEARQCALFSLLQN
jgi:hypothetical protein